MALPLLLLGGMWAVGFGSAAPQVDASGSPAITDTSHSTVTLSHPVGSGVNPYVVLTVHYPDACGATTATLGTRDFAFLVEHANTNKACVQMLGLAGPGAGQSTITVSFASAVASSSVQAQSFFHVDAASPTGATASASGQGDAALSITTGQARSSVLAAVTYQAGLTGTPTGGAFETYDTGPVGTGGGQHSAFGSRLDAPTPGDYTLGWTLPTGSGAPKFAAVAVELRQAPPVAIPGEGTVPEDETMSGMLQGAATSSMTFTVTAPPDNGQLTVDQATGAFAYEPGADFFGTDSFRFTVTDADGFESVPSTFSITVDAVNDPPSFSAGGDDTVLEDSGLRSIPWATDIQGGPANEDQAVTFTVSNDNAALFATQPAVSASGALSFTPAPDAHGSAVVRVKAVDSEGTQSAAATATITVTPVEDAPTAQSQDLSTPEDVELIGTVTATDPEGDPISFSVVTSPSSGTLSLESTGAFTYAPAPDFFGDDEFAFVASDAQGDSDPATVTLTVTPANDPPSFTLMAELVLDEDAPPQVVSGWATDIIGGPGNEDQAVTFAITTTQTGLFSVQPAADGDGTLRFNLAQDAHGTATLHVTATDSDGATSASQQADIVIAAVNDLPTARSQSLSTNEDEVLTGAVVGDDVDGDDLLYHVSTSPTSGTLSLESTGAFTYTPAADFFGADEFAFVASDMQGDFSPGTVAITVQPVNDAPSFSLTDIVIEEDSGHYDQPWVADASPGPENEAAQTLAYAATAADVALFAQLPEVKTDGRLRFTPAADAFGTAMLSITATDSDGATSTRTATLTIQPVNDPPTAEHTTVSTAAGLAVTGAVIAEDIDGDTLSFSMGTAPAQGTVSLADDGSFTYTPAATAAGSDAFTVIVSDGVATATATVDVTFVAQIVVEPSSLTIREGGSASLAVVLSDPPSAPVLVVLSSAAPDLTFPATLTFDATSWSTPQTVGVSLADDGVADGDQGATLLLAIDTVASAPEYQATPAQSVGLALRDIQDTDGDGLRDVDEALLMTDPFVPDTELIVPAEISSLEFFCGGGPTDLERLSVAGSSDLTLKLGCHLDEPAGGQPGITIGAVLDLTRSTSDGDLQLRLPPGRIGGPGWQGSLQVPTLRDVGMITVPGGSVQQVVEIGFGSRLELESPARLLLPGQAGRMVAYSHGGPPTAITLACDDVVAPTNLPAGGECAIDSGDDLLVWTYHMTLFATYIPAPTGGVAAGGGGGPAAAAVPPPKQPPDQPGPLPTETPASVRPVVEERPLSGPEETIATPDTAPGPVTGALHVWALLSAAAVLTIAAADRGGSMLRRVHDARPLRSDALLGGRAATAWRRRLPRRWRGGPSDHERLEDVLASDAVATFAPPDGLEGFFERVADDEFWR